MTVGTGRGKMKKKMGATKMFEKGKGSSAQAQSRESRLEHARQVAKEAKNWSSNDLRAAYAQPRTVAAARKREEGSGPGQT